jgi:hypothetical protein
MKTNLLQISIAGVLAAAAAFAQSSITLNADVPFSFVAGGKVLPAGHYTVTQGLGPAVLIRSQQSRGGGKAAAFAMTTPVYSRGTRHDARLVFHRYGSTCFLSEIWGSGSDGKELPATTQERRLAAAAKSSSNTIIASLR